MNQLRHNLRRKVLFGVIPDVYSSIVLASEIKKYLFATFPLTINGASEKVVVNARFEKSKLRTEELNIGRT